MSFDDTPRALRAKWEADKARTEGRVDDEPPLGKREFEDALRANPDELDTYLVYADWLADRGDEWGQLITVQHALETLPRFGATVRRDELSRRETLLRFQLSRRLWGSLGEHVYNADTQRYLCDLIDAEWRCGFVRAARIRSYEDGVIDTLVRGLAAAPVALVLRQLDIDGPLKAALAPALRDLRALVTLTVDGVPIDLGGDLAAQLGDAVRPRYDDVDE